MKVFVLAFGKLKTAGLREAANYYLKVIQPWAAVQEVELKPVAVPEKTFAIKKVVQEKENRILMERIQEILPSNGKFYLLDESGKGQNTLGWAKRAQDWEALGPSTIALCVGSSLGFSEELKKKAAGIFSLGPQTLPHELARVVLLEQLYRAWSVVRGHPYHNET